MEKKQYVATKIPTTIIDEIDRIVATREYATRSHFLEIAAMDLVRKHAKKPNDREVVQGME